MAVCSSSLIKVNLVNLTRYFLGCELCQLRFGWPPTRANSGQLFKGKFFFIFKNNCSPISLLLKPSELIFKLINLLTLIGLVKYCSSVTERYLIFNVYFTFSISLDLLVKFELVVLLL